MGYYVLRYFLRDADNYKEYGEAYFTGQPGVVLADLRADYDGETGNFIPRLVGLPSLMSNSFCCDYPEDTTAHELLELDWRNGELREPAQSIDDLRAAFAQASDLHWRDPDRYYRTIFITEVVSKDRLETPPNTDYEGVVISAVVRHTKLTYDGARSLVRVVAPDAFSAFEQLR